MFAAFSGLFGVLVLGPASSLEQQSALRAGAGRAAASPMLTRAGVALLVVTVLVLLPAGGWQHRLFGDDARPALLALVLGAPVVLALAVLRGLAVGRGAYRLVAATHVVAGVGTLVLPLALLAAGVAPVTSFVAGAAFAWLPALLLLCTRTGSGRAAAAEVATGPARHHRAPGGRPTCCCWRTCWRSRRCCAGMSGQLGERPVADAQLLVSLSRLATTAVLGLLPLVLGRMGAERSSPAAPGCPSGAAAGRGRRRRRGGRHGAAGRPRRRRR